MLRSLKDLEQYKVSATDGEIGTVTNFFLDDDRWVVRDLVVDTGGFFLGGRGVLISPISFGRADGESRCFHVALTMEKIRNSPGIDTDKPVSRQHERDYYQYYGYLNYWGYPGIWGMGAYPGLLANGWGQPPPAHEVPGDVHLRSAREVRGYGVLGTDEAIGHVDDFVVDDETWEVRYLVIDTSNWWFGKKVLIPPCWATGGSWEERQVHVALPRTTIKDSPEWDPSVGVNREYESRLYDYYGRPVYWAPPARPAEVEPPHRPGVHPA
jgi:sporulation protein YlmC with PRC-barrel domain